MFKVVWGFASTGVVVGCIETYDTYEEASTHASKLSKENDNPACGYWVEKEES